MINPIVLISGSYNAFDEGWDGVGVYACSGNYISQTFKYPIYIGSSINLQNRIEVNHAVELNRNKHSNPIFQAGWNKHSEKEGFIWFLLETCSPDDVLIFEQKYLDLYRPFVDEFGGFNIAHYASAPMKGRKASEETRKRNSEASKKRMTSSEEIRNILVEGRKLGCLKKIRSFRVISPDGKLVDGTNVKKFCRENKLSDTVFLGMLDGEYQQCKGWMLNRFPIEITDITPEQFEGLKRQYRENKYNSVYNSRAKIFQLISPDGEVINGSNLRKFCRDNHLDRQRIQWVLSGKLDQYKNWKKP